jgi:hypothetical protein
MNSLGSLLKKWWPTILVAGGALWSAFGQQIVNYVANHPKWTAVLGALTIILAHLTPSPVTQSPSGGSASFAGSTVASKLPAWIIVVVLLLGGSMVGCSVYKDANNTVNIIGQILKLGQADIPALEASGVIAAADGPAVEGWITTGLTLQGQASTCIAGAGANGTKAALTGCVLTFVQGFLNPAELAGLQIKDPKSQHQVLLWATALTLGIDGYCDIAGCAAPAPPTAVGTAGTTAPATTEELEQFKARLQLPAGI